MTENLYDFAIQKAAISGQFEKEYEFSLQWLPQYMEEFLIAMQGIQLNWQSCKFMKSTQNLIPDKHGVYCFSIKLGKPLVDDFHIPLYIGKAAPQFISERFGNYLTERQSVSGREKIVFIP